MTLTQEICFDICSASYLDSIHLIGDDKRLLQSVDSKIIMIQYIVWASLCASIACILLRQGIPRMYYKKIKEEMLKDTAKYV